MPLPGEIWNLAAQKFEAVSEEDIEDRVREGTHTFGTGIKVPVVDQDGVPWFIPSEEAGDALAQGYQIETTADSRARELRDKYASGSWNKTRAFFEEIVRSATVGVSDVAARAVGVEAEGLRVRKEELGTGATIVANVLGVGGAFLIPAPGTTAGAVAKAGLGAARVVGAPVRGVAALGTAVTKATGAALNVGARTGAARVAARTIEAAVGNAVEGAAYQTGVVMSAAALGDPNLTASRVAGEVGMGVVLGGAFGIGAAGVGAGLSKFKGALVEALDPAKIAKAAGKWGGKGIGLAADAEDLTRRLKPWAKPGEELTFGDLGNYALNEKQAALGGGSIMRTSAKGKPAAVVNARTAETNAKLVGDEAIERMANGAATLDDRLGRPAVDLYDLYRPPVPAKDAVPDRIVAEATGILDDAGQPIMRQRVIPGRPAEPAVPGGEMWRIVDDLYDPAMKDIRDGVAAKLTEWADGFAGGPVSFRRAIHHKRAVDEFLRWDKSAIPSPALKRAREIRHKLNQYIDSRFDAEAQTVGMDVADWLKAKKDFAWSKEIGELAGSLANKRENQRAFSLTDHLAALGIGASLGGASPMWAVASFSGAAMNKMAREYGPQVVAAAMDRASKFHFLQRSAASAEQRMQSALQGVLAAMPSTAQRETFRRNVIRLGPTGYPIQRMPVSSLDDIVIEPFSKERTAAIEEAYKAGKQGELPPIRIYRDEMGKLRVDDGQHRLEAARRHGVPDIDVEMLQGTPVDAMGAADLFEANLRVIDRYATNPELLADALDKSLAPIQDVAPNVANSIAMRTARAVMYLHQEAPRPAKPANILSKPLPVPDMERAVFNKKVQAIELGPVSLLEDAAEGISNPDGVAALEVVDSFALEDARQRVLDALADGGGAGLDHDRQVALGVFLGIRLATTLEPGVIVSLQAGLEQQAAALNGARRLEIDMGSEAMESETQGLERRRHS